MNILSVSNLSKFGLKIYSGFDKPFVSNLIFSAINFFCDIFSKDLFIFNIVSSLSLMTIYKLY